MEERRDGKRKSMRKRTEGNSKNEKGRNLDEQVETVNEKEKRTSGVNILCE